MPPAPSADSASAAAPAWGDAAAGEPAAGARSRVDSEEQAPSVGQRASERAMAAAARAARNAPAAPPHAPADDFPPEPDDPFPPDPRDEPPAPHDPGRPVPHDDGSPAPERGATAPTAIPAPDAAPLEVEDEGRDALPAEEPRTFGQNALKRALAEGRVVRSLPAAHRQQQGAAPGGSTAEPAPGPGAPGADGSAASEADGSAAAGPISSSAVAPDGAAASAPHDPHPSGPHGSATARAAASWGAAAAVTGTVPGPGQQAPAPSASSAPSAPAAPAGPSAQAPRSGAALVREAAMASRNAGQRLRGSRPEPDAAPEADIDPTGGATRDDEDAVVATRNGREVIEKMLGGKVLEVIDETGPR